MKSLKWSVVLWATVLGLVAQAELVDYNGKSILMTKIDLQRAHEIYDRVRAIPNIPYSYPEGCEAKAHKLSLVLDSEGIASAKAFVEGNLFWRRNVFWTFHVAAVVLIEEERESHLYVLDPLLFEDPVPYDMWRKELQAHPSTKVKETYFTNQYIYSPDEKKWRMSYYDPYFTNDMEKVFRVINRKIEWQNKKRGFFEIKEGPITCSYKGSALQPCSL